MKEYPVLELDPCGNVIKMGTGDATNNDATNNDTPAPIEQTIVKGRILTLPKDMYKKDSKIRFYNNIQEYFVCELNRDPDRLKIDKTCSSFIKKGGEAIVGPKGLLYMDSLGNKYLMDVDPGTVISNVVNYGEPNANPIILKNPNGLRPLDESGSGKYYVEQIIGSQYRDGYSLVFKRGPKPEVLEDEKSKNIIRFNLDDEDIQDFEDYYVTNKLVEKTPDGMYKVIANKITYAAKTYVKGTILKLDQA